MAEEFRRRLSLDLPWTTILKVIPAAAALVWLWLQLVQLVLVLLVAVLLAVTLDPVMEWFERRGWPRWRGAPVFLALLAAIRRVAVGWRGTRCATRARSPANIWRTFNSTSWKVPQWIQDAVGDAGSGEGLSAM